MSTKASNQSDRGGGDLVLSDLSTGCVNFCFGVHCQGNVGTNVNGYHSNSNHTKALTVIPNSIFNFIPSVTEFFKRPLLIIKQGPGDRLERKPQGRSEQRV